MRNDFRQYFVYNLDVRAKKEGAALPTMADMVSIWSKHAMAKTAQMSIRKNTATLLIGAVDIDQASQSAALLIRISDTTAPNAVYSNPAADQFTEHAKAGQTGGDTGIHVMVSIAPELGFVRRYTCLIERNVNLRFDLVQRILSKVLHFEYQTVPTAFAYPHPGGQKDAQGNIKMERCRPFVELQGRASDAFVNDIETGTLTGIALVKATAANAVGGQQFLVENELELRLKVDHGHAPANLWAGIRTAVGAKAVDFPVAKLQYKLPGRAKAVSVKIDAATGAPLEDLYIRSFDVTNIVPWLAASSKTIVPHLVSRLRLQLDSERSI